MCKVYLSIALVYVSILFLTVVPSTAEDVPVENDAWMYDVLRQKEKPPCPDVCRGGPSGFDDATRECRKPRCSRGVKCQVQACTLLPGTDGFKCSCPSDSPGCPDICRVGRLARRQAKAECKSRPRCPNSRRRCRVRRCILDGGSGYECTCPVRATPEPLNE